MGLTPRKVLLGLQPNFQVSMDRIAALVVLLTGLPGLYISPSVEF